jgi:hypothetical protein
MHRVPGRSAAFLAAIMGMWLAAPAVAWGQSANADRRGWEIEGYGGFMSPSSGGAEGGATLPPPGSPIATSSPIFPSRRVPSWFFGDGATLLNLVNQQFAVPARIEPLDAALGGSGLASGDGFAGGVRVRRGLTERFAAEFSLDVFASSADLSDELLAAAEVSRASFAPAFQGLLATGPFTDVDVDASSATAGSAREIAVTGALVWQLGDSGGFTPYVTLGGGVISGAGDGPSLTLEARYRFQVLGEVPIDETDRLTVRQDSRTTVVGVAGAGLRRDVSERWGIRFDGRVLIGPHTTRLLIDTDPNVAQGAPADFVESFTTPAIQFSNNPSTGRESSLGGPPLQGFETFVEDGLQVRLLISAGVFFRF